MKHNILIFSLILYSFVCVGQKKTVNKVIEKSELIYNLNLGNNGSLLAVNNSTHINVYHTEPFNFSYSINISACSIDFADSSDLIVCGDFQGQVHLFQRELQLKKFQAHKSKITNIKLNRSNSLMATTSTDSIIRIWSLDKCELISTLEYQSGLVCDFEFSFDNKYLIFSTSVGEVIVWEYAKENIISTLKSHEGIVRNIAISPDGQKIASCGNDGRIIIYPNYFDFYALKKTHKNNWIMDIEFINKDYLLSVGRDNRLVMNNINQISVKGIKSNFFYSAKPFKLSGEKYLNNIEILNNVNQIAISILGKGFVFTSCFYDIINNTRDLSLNIGSNTKFVKDYQEFRVFLDNVCQIRGIISNHKTIKQAWIINANTDDKTEIEIKAGGSFVVDVVLPKVENAFFIIFEDVDVNLQLSKYEIKIMK